MFSKKETQYLPSTQQNYQSQGSVMTTWELFPFDVRLMFAGKQSYLARLLTYYDVQKRKYFLYSIATVRGPLHEKKSLVVQSNSSHHAPG